MTSATDKLRAMLDERGVEHYDGTERTLWGYEQTGEGTGIYRFAASEVNGGFLQFDMFRISPEQAIATTLGNDGVERSKNGVSERDQLKAENAKLREQGERLFDKTLELATENAKLRAAGINLPEYPVTQFKPKDLERENAKLRELCEKFADYVSYDRCEGCACKSSCRDGQVDECWMLAEIREIASELGIEVDE